MKILLVDDELEYGVVMKKNSTKEGLSCRYSTKW